MLGCSWRPTGALLVTAMRTEDKSSNLRLALESNREIGVALGC